MRRSSASSAARVIASPDGAAHAAADEAEVDAGDHERVPVDGARPVERARLRAGLLLGRRDPLGIGLASPRTRARRSARGRRDSSSKLPSSKSCASALAQAQAEVVVALGADVQVALEPLVVDERLARRAAAPLGRHGAAGCGYLSHRPAASTRLILAEQAPRRSASVASSSASTSTSARRELLRLHEHGGRAPGYRLLGGPFRTQLQLQVGQHAGGPAQAVDRARLTGQLERPLRLSARQLHLDRTVQRGDLVVGQLEDLPHAREGVGGLVEVARLERQLGDVELRRARPPGRPRRPCAPRPAPPPACRASGTSRPGRSPRSRRRPSGRPPAPAVETASSRWPSWNAVWPSAVSATSSSGSISSTLRKASLASPVRPSAASASARSRQASADSGLQLATVRSRSTASSEPTSTPARPASLSSSTSSGAPSRPAEAASWALPNAPASKCAASLSAAMGRLIPIGRARQRPPRSPACRGPTGAGSRRRSRRSSAIPRELSMNSSVSGSMRKNTTALVAPGRSWGYFWPNRSAARAISSPWTTLQPPRPWTPLVWRQSSAYSSIANAAAGLLVDVPRGVRARLASRSRRPDRR